MNKKIRELAELAEFVFWNGDESWGPPGENNIDWSADYSKEFEQFISLLVSDILLHVDVPEEQARQIIKRYLA